MPSVYIRNTGLKNVKAKACSKAHYVNRKIPIDSSRLCSRPKSGLRPNSGCAPASSPSHSCRASLPTWQPQTWATVCQEKASGLRPRRREQKWKHEGWAGQMYRREHTMAVVFMPRVGGVKAAADHTVNTSDRLQQSKSRPWLCHLVPCRRSGVGHVHTCEVMSGSVQAEDPDKRVHTRKAPGFSHMLRKSFQGKPPLALTGCRCSWKHLKSSFHVLIFAFMYLFVQGESSLRPDRDGYPWHLGDGGAVGPKAALTQRSPGQQQQQYELSQTAMERQAVGGKTAESNREFLAW